MKEIRSLINSLVVCGAALAMVSTLAAQTVVNNTAKVIRVKGAARYTTGNNVWQPLKVGAEVKPGTIIQTSNEKGSFVDLVLGDGSGGAAVRPVSFNPQSSGPGSSGARPSAEQNVVRIWENSALGIDKLTSLQTGADVVTETQLDLKAGRIFGSVKKMSAASKYEVKLPNGVAGIRGTTYEITAEGVVKVSEGSVVVAYVDPATGKVITVVVNSGEQWDARNPQAPPTRISSSVSSAMNDTANGMRTVIPVPPTTITFDHTVDHISPHQ